MLYFALYRGTVQKLPNPAFNPGTAPDATDGGKGEKELLKEEVIGTFV